MLQKLRAFGKSIMREIKIYQRALRHERTPWPAKALLWLAVTYALSPVDIIPDFIPVLGQIDDLVLVPALVMLALKIIPHEIMLECRSGINEEARPTDDSG
jgi:uncharacterized membrane protein YkvA (DUF1232 family)